MTTEIRKSLILKILIDKIEELEEYKKTLYYDTDGTEISSITGKIILLNAILQKVLLL